MSTTYISIALRRLVAQRAHHLCEYCLIHEDDTFFGCEVDHVISEKHRGPTEEGNLAYACLTCNRNKGSDIASLSSATGTLVRFFNPRSDRWSEHFRLEDADGITIVPLSDIGEATVRIFGMNAPERLLERQALRSIDRYPVPMAQGQIDGTG